MLHIYTSEQELIPDTAHRLIFQTYLLLSKLSFTVQVAPNARSMSPEGTVPFVVLESGNKPLILSSFEQMVEFLNKQVYSSQN